MKNSRCQRIEAAALGWSLRDFGISVDGRTDMDGDGLVDVAVGAQGAAVVLRHRDPPGSFQIPFFKDCGDDDECVTDLVLKATTDIVGSRQSPHILRKGRRRMLVQVELENRGENAYNASLWLQLPGNLHFSSLVLQEPSSVKLECSTLGGQRRRCSVGYPVFRSQAKVSFTLELEFSCSVLLDRAELP
ncbi:integrin alpha-10-like, partial [Geospiza fortis]|uniref:Integrin alpha-10-like n=1 Tax=Geospiza fortis TaxID=48883 RepID=A0A8N5F232_GEOFO